MTMDVHILYKNGQIKDTQDTSSHLTINKFKKLGASRQGLLITSSFWSKYVA